MIEIKEKETLDMKNIIDQINIRSGDKVLVSSNILEISFNSSFDLISNNTSLIEPLNNSFKDAIF